MDDAPALEFVGAPAKLAFPELCANCGAATSKRMRIDRRLPRHPDSSAKFRLVHAQVPFCDACLREHRARLPRLGVGKLLGAVLTSPSTFLAIACGAGAWLVGMRIQALGLEARPYGLLALCGTLVLVLLRSLRAAARSVRLKTLRSSPVADAFDFSPDLSGRFEPRRHLYILRNSLFAAEFEALNRDHRWDHTSRTTRWGARLRNVVIGVLALAGLGWWLLTLAENHAQ